ncbi:MAG: fatty acid desaturase [Alphaproteobacteria bacterium]
MPKSGARRPFGLLRAASEGLTLALLIAVYAGWLVLIFSGWPWWITCPLLTVVVVQFLSLQHEALHGHPTRSAILNEALVSLPLGLCFPFRRYRTLHLRHHNDENLTDPFDDPESWYFEPDDFANQPRLIQLVWQANATLVGRLLLGPILSCVGLIRRDGEAILSGNRDIGFDWALHALGLAVVFVLLGIAGFNPLLYIIAVAYPAMSVLMIRSFAEHRASEAKEHRTAIIPDRGPLALLFLNNNLHAVHHAHPTVPWYRLPRLFSDNRAAFEESNGGYGYRSYLHLFRRHWRKPLDSVAHPLWNRKNRSRPLD